MNKTILAFVVLIAVGIAGLVFLGDELRPNASKTSTALSAQTFEVATERVSYYGRLEGYLARPQESGEYPALILIHEWWGLNEDIESIARRFAEEGYVALAVDLYDGIVTINPDEARALSGAVRENVSSAFENLQAAVDYLRTRDDVDKERLASVGWCFGGMWAYQMALNDLGINASVMYYGQFNPDDDFSMMRADILGHFGEDDAVVAVDTVREFQARLATINGSHEVYIYPNVGHGFANYRGGTNLAYNEDAAERAWERTSDFLRQAFSR